MAPGRTVLIVDDHSGFRSVARMVIEAAGWRVVGEADSVEAAVETARRLRPDVVLLDVNLPDGDGFRAAERIREAAEPPVVVLTSSRDDVGYAGLARCCGAQGFIPKAELSCGAIEGMLR